MHYDQTRRISPQTRTVLQTLHYKIVLKLVRWERSRKLDFKYLEFLADISYEMLQTRNLINKRN